MYSSTTKKRLKLTVLVALGSVIALPAYGYIDPGTGSLLIQSIIGAIAAVGVTLKLYWHKIKVFFLAKKPTDSAAEVEDKPDA